MIKLLSALIAAQVLLGGMGYADIAKPKYGPKESPQAVPLALSNDYFRSNQHPAPAFWALISFYIPQSTGASCSSATVAMVLNAARAHLKKSADEKVITEKMLLDKIDVGHWKQRLTSSTGYLGQFGADLDLVGKVTEAAMKDFGFPKTSVTVVHVEKPSPQAKSNLVAALQKMSDKNFIIANFDQKRFTNDTEVGHFAPVGAYDEETGRVLILDPDREYYEPYWISVDTFLDGMATLDSSKKMHRGYVVVNTMG